LDAAKLSTIFAAIFLALKNALIKNFIIYTQVKYLFENIRKPFSMIQCIHHRQPTKLSI